MDHDLRDWLRTLGAPRASTEPVALSDAGADFLTRVAADGTLKAALAEIAASDRELAS